MSRLRFIRPLAGSHRENGQILVLFVIALVAMLWMIRLLIDGASALTHRRAMQDSSDAAALAGANVLIDRGCAANIDEVRTAALASLATNNWGADRAMPVVTCAPDRDDIGVTVALTANSPGLFFSAIPVTVDSTAVNGARFEGIPSVLTLHDTRCQSFYLNGNVVLNFAGGVHVNSNGTGGVAPCNPSEAAALGKGTGNTITLEDEARMVVHGEHKNINTTPAPLSGPRLDDPFADYDEPSTRPDLFPLPLNPAIDQKHNGAKTAWILSPGKYTTGSLPSPTSGEYVVFLPGVYVFDNRALRNSGGVLCTLPEDDPNQPGHGPWTFLAIEAYCTSVAAWSAVCPTLADQRTGGIRCGALLHWTGFINCSRTNPPEILSAGGGGETLLRQYYSGAAEGSELEPYDGFLLWFSRTHAQDPGCNASLRGGGASQFSGTVYGATTNLSMAGGGAGAAGQLTLQMIVNTVEFKGGSIFNFQYDGQELVRIALYGLVE